MPNVLMRIGGNPSFMHFFFRRDASWSNTRARIDFDESPSFTGRRNIAWLSRHAALSALKRRGTRPAVSLLRYVFIGSCKPVSASFKYCWICTLEHVPSSFCWILIDLDCHVSKSRYPSTTVPFLSGTRRSSRSHAGTSCPVPLTGVSLLYTRRFMARVLNNS